MGQRRTAGEGRKTCVGFKIFRPTPCLGAMPGSDAAQSGTDGDRMSHGGARNRSGPPADPNSARSERRSYSLTALPREGYQGNVPDWPLLPHNMPEFHERELDVWAESWRTPQACAWSMESWRWTILAEYCRLKTDIENSANASLIGQLHRYRDQLGLTPAGMRDNGWKIAAPESSGLTVTDGVTGETREPQRQRRLRA